MMRGTSGAILIGLEAGERNRRAMPRKRDISMKDVLGPHARRRSAGCGAK